MSLPIGKPTPPAGIELHRVRVPMLGIHRSANNVQSDRESILLRVEAADGVVGFSECPTLSGEGYATESTDAAWAALTGELASSALAGTTAVGFAAPAASSAIADALLDCELRRSSVSLATWLGRQTAQESVDRVAWTAVLADVDLDPSEAVERAALAVEAGASMVKLKVAGAGGLDGLAERVEAIRAATGVAVAADANGSIGAEAAAALDELALAYVEQPLAPGTPWEEMAALTSAMRTPVALDESIVSLDSLADAIGAGALDVASVKPARIGGSLAGARAMALAAGSGIGCFVGGMFELGIGRAAALALASLSGATLPTDLGPSRRYVERDICDPLVTGADCMMSVPGGPGLGRIPYADLVDEYAVDHAVFGVLTA